VWIFEILRRRMSGRTAAPDHPVTRNDPVNVFVDATPMARICGTLVNQKLLMASDLAACEFCLRVYPPQRIAVWCDPDWQGIEQTAVCPCCGKAAVAGYKHLPVGAGAAIRSETLDTHRVTQEAGTVPESDQPGQ
jgi:hypothetical protein